MSGFLINPYVFSAGGPPPSGEALLHFDGTNGSTSIIDESGKTWTAVGNAQLSTTDSKFGTACLLLDGSGDYVDATADVDYQFGTGDFTIECFGRWDSFTGNRFLFGWGSNHGVYTFNIGTPELAYFDGAGNQLTIAGGLATSTYYHVAISRQGTTMRLFKDGVKAASDFFSSVNFSGTNFRIGAQTTGSGEFQGRIDELRITKGTAVYTANFTPPSGPF